MKHVSFSGLCVWPLEREATASGVLGVLWKWMAGVRDQGAFPMEIRGKKLPGAQSPTGPAGSNPPNRFGDPSIPGKPVA